jgi:hypothetical protein
MPRRRLSVRTIREVLRLRWQSGLSEREISASCHISATAVRSYLQRAEDAGLSWPLPADLQDAQLEQRLFPPPATIGADVRPAINWIEVNKQLKRKGPGSSPLRFIPDKSGRAFTRLTPPLGRAPRWKRSWVLLFAILQAVRGMAAHSSRSGDDPGA